jgi:inner membrane protein
MDSVTQIVLGAACGEAVAGKKLGNRAMLWGAVGGTIPDLDVLAALFTDQITSTSFHRGIMHSFLFAVLAPFALAWLVERFYASNAHRRPGYKLGFMIIWLLFYVGAAAGINFIPVALGEGLSWPVFIPTLVLGVLFAWLLIGSYWRRDLSFVQVPRSTWVWLFFWSIFTHPILDCFTNWGTQIWQPFSDERVQWCTVSVVDPIATLPFALALFVGVWLRPEARSRRLVLWLGVAWFCGYLAYTVWHKSTVNHAFEQTLRAQSIDYERIYTNPSIFNNIVWYGVAEADSTYHFGLYGFNDRVPSFRKISTIPKNHQLLEVLPSDSRARKFLLWFTEGYYNVIPYKGDTIQVNDLRFGLLGDSLRGKNYVFPFLVFKRPDGEWDLIEANRVNPDLEENKRAFGDLWRRVQGLE